MTIVSMIAGIILGVLVFILIELRSLNENLCEFTRIGYRIEKNMYAERMGGCE